MKINLLLEYRVKEGNVASLAFIRLITIGITFIIVSMRRKQKYWNLVVPVSKSFELNNSTERKMLKKHDIPLDRAYERAAWRKIARTAFRKGNRNGSRAWKEKERERRRRRVDGARRDWKGKERGEDERGRLSGSGALIHFILCAVKRRSIKVEKSERDSTRVAEWRELLWSRGEALWVVVTRRDERE